MKAGKRAFILYTADGTQRRVCAPSLRTALRGLDEKLEIVAAVDAVCLPPPAAGSSPFLAVFLRNPRFTPPPLE